jgi:hypothetical protein
MKTNLKKTLGLAALGITLLTNTVPTLAGSVNTPEVVIKRTPYLEASGSMVGARYSADPQQSIGCSIYAYQDVPVLWCRARTAKSSLDCSSTDARHIDSVQRMTDSSNMFFRTDPATGACTIVYIANHSYHLK